LSQADFLSIPKTPGDNTRAKGSGIGSGTLQPDEPNKRWELKRWRLFRENSAAFDADILVFSGVLKMPPTMKNRSVLREAKLVVDWTGCRYNLWLNKKHARPAL